MGVHPTQTFAALQPRASEATFAAIILRDNTHALVMHSLALERLPGGAKPSSCGLAFPRTRMHSKFKGSVIAKQALETTLGPLERISAGANDGIRHMEYIGRLSDTLYYEADVYNLKENEIALYAAWQQRAATPTEVTNWTGFELVDLDELVGRLDRSDDAAAAGLVTRRVPSTSCHGDPTETQVKTDERAKSAGDIPQVMAHFGESLTEDVHHEELLNSPGDTLRHLTAMAVFNGLPQATATSIPQQGHASGDFAKEEASQVDLAEHLKLIHENWHAKADELRGKFGQGDKLWSDVGQVSTTEDVHKTEEEYLAHAAADLAAKAARQARLEPPSEPPPDDPTLGNDDNTNVARTRVPGWAPEINRAVLCVEQDADEYIKILKNLAAATGFVERKTEGTFELVDGLLFRIEKHGPEGKAMRRQVVVPAKLRSAFLRAFHDRTGHVGQKRVLAILRERAWWVGMRRDVRSYIRCCPTCALTKLTRIQAGQARALGDGDHPGDVWTCDILDIDSHLRHRYKEILKASDEPYDPEAVDKIYHPHKLLVFIDRYTRWAEAFLLEKDPSADEVLDIFVNEIVRRHSYPRAVTSDRGSNLMQGSVAEYYKACGIQLVASDSYMHNTAGLVERFNGTLKDVLRGFLTDVDEDADVIGLRWWRYLTYALLSYNTSDATSSGYSPFYLMYGRDASTPLQNTLLPRPIGAEKSHSEHVQEHVLLLHSAWEHARENIAAQASLSRQEQNLSRDISFELKPGDRVLIKKPNYKGLEVPYSGPFRVAKVLDNDRVQLRDLHRVMHDEFHISRLKLYPYVDNDGNVSADREEYIIKDIKSHRKAGEDYEYLIRWDGWNASYDEWVAESEFNEHALELVAAYWQGVRANDDTATGTLDSGVTKSTVEQNPVTKAAPFRSHREQHIASAPSTFKTDEQTAPEAATSRVANAKAKSKGKKQKQKKQSKQAAASTTAPDATAEVGAAQAPSPTSATATETPPPTTKNKPSRSKAKIKATAASSKPSRSAAEVNYTS